jgi:hypothetical protein
LCPPPPAPWPKNRCNRRFLGLPPSDIANPPTPNRCTCLVVLELGRVQPQTLLRLKYLSSSRHHSENPAPAPQTQALSDDSGPAPPFVPSHAHHARSQEHTKQKHAPFHLSSPSGLPGGTVTLLKGPWVCSGGWFSTVYIGIPISSSSSSRVLQGPALERQGSLQTPRIPC